MKAGRETPLRVLMLEDSRFDAELVGVTVRASYPDALLHVTRDEAGFADALARQEFDLILSDYELPGYSGPDALDHARRAAPRTPFIFVSGVIGEENAVEMLKRGATDYVSKNRLARLPFVIDRALREAGERAARADAEQQLRRAKEDAERANHAKDRFLAVLSHELRTPLSPIASAAQLLEQQAVVPTELRDLLPMIRRNVALEARLIEDLLDVTAISAGKITLRTAPLDMRPLVERVVDMVGETIRDKRITLTLHWDAARRVVDGDEARLQQVLWNIVRNAAKFTPEGGHIELRIDNEGDFLRLRCMDDGIGIAPTSQTKIFSAFEQADADVTRRFGGLGLGLAIAQGLVAEHHGTLEVASGGPGRGSTFTLRLATLPVDALPAPPAPAAGTRADGSDGHPVRMLLVEDNEDAAFALSLAFEYYGYQVTHAGTLHEALATARTGEFDVVVTDLGLPDGNGIALGEALSDRLPVIALSGFGSAEDVRRTAAAGFARHLVKPADPDDIHAAVMSVLAEARD